ncbi:MAG: hypothetical protein OXE75_08980 [bacterium]|nr:hypothetical protein [bacterium]
MTANGLNPSEALRGIRVGISVSESADLSRLGLSAAHAEHTIGEVARAVLLAGGTLVYGGRIKPSGFTQYLMHEVRRYGVDHGEALTLCLAAPEHNKLSYNELDEIDRTLGTRGRIVCLDEEGYEIEGILSVKPDDPHPCASLDVAQAYSALRRHMAAVTDARVLVGGNLSDFVGAMPGIIEEAIVSVQAQQPLYVAAGLGGAAALVAKRLHLDDLSWAPDDFPARPADDERIDHALGLLATVAASSGWRATSCGLDAHGIRQLAASHRTSEIASLVVGGLTQATC